MTESVLIRERYELLETLGAGGEARVVKALDHRHDRFVALKIRHAGDERMREDLLGEARILLAIPPHPALPLVREDFFEGDDYIVAMDWVDGTDLARLLAERGRPGLAPSSALAYLAQAAEALTHLHSQHAPVIHGDVKPGNLILTKGGRVKLVDFGLSSAPNEFRRRSGTPGFRAPELAARGVPSRASDIYALAATAFALLTGSAPAGMLPTWEGIDPAQAEQLEAAIRLGMATDPTRRPATPGELVERLRAGWAEALPTGVVTFCLSDIEGSTAMWDSEPGAMAAALVRHDALIADCVQTHGGQLLKSMGEGDSTVSVFDSPRQALDAALAATRAIATEQWPGGLRITVRFGIHTGEAERRGSDYFGPTINLAARLCGQADGGQIFLSSVTSDLIARHLPADCVLVDLGPHRLKELAAPERIHAIKAPGVQAPLSATECPYRGLLAFEPEDRSFFFGREHVVGELIGRLEPGRLLAVVGASGSGKSSVLRAGLVAAVRAGEVRGLSRAFLMTPGADAALDMPDERHTLVVVDQFEELFTLCGDANRRAVFLDALLARRGPVAIGVRADLYGELGGHAELAYAVADNQVLLGAMTDAELERAVTEPARMAGLRLEQGLVELVLRDVAGESGALPLLSHALSATWERRDGRALTVEGYRDSGGVASALAQTADSAVAAFPEEARRLVRNVFLRLSEHGEDTHATRRRVAIDELVPENASPDAVRALLDRLADARLVTLGEGTAELAHEVLIREWPTLRGWLDEDEERIRLQRRLAAAARLWDTGGREPSDLYRGARLAAAVDSAHDLNATEREFLDASQSAAGRAQRRLRLGLVVVIVLLGVAIAGAIVALDQRSVARSQARVAEAQRLGAQALTEASLDRSLLLARQGFQIDDSPVTRGYLLAALLRSPAAIGMIRGAGNPLTALDLAPDGRTLAVGDDRGNVQFFDAVSEQRIGRQFQTPTGAVAALRFSPDGTRLAVAGNGLVDILEVRTHENTRTLLVAAPFASPLANVQFAVRTLTFSRDSHELWAGAIGNGRRRGAYIVRWDVRTGRRLGSQRMARSPEPTLVGLTVRGSRIVTSSAAERATIVRDSANLRPLRRLRGGGTPAALSPDGRFVALGAADGSVRLLVLRTGIVRVASDRHDGAVTDLRFAPDSRTLLSAGSDGRLIRWNVADARQIETLAGHAGAVSRVTIAPDGRTAYSAGEDGTVISWDLSGNRRLDRPFSVPPRGPMVLPAEERGNDPADLAPEGQSLPYAGLRVAVSPGGGSFAVPDRAGYVDVLDSHTLALARRIPVSPGSQVSAVALSPDGRTLAATTADGRLRFADLLGRLGPLLPAYGTDPTDRAAWSLAFSSDGHWLATAGLPGAALRLWDARRRRLVNSSELSPYPLAADMAFTPDSTKLAVIALDAPTGGAFVEVLSVPQLSQLKTVRVPPAKTLQFSPDGHLLILGDEQGQVWLYDTRTWKPRGRPLNAHAGAMDAVNLSPDAHTLATTSDDGTTQLWDFPSGRSIGAALPGAAQRDAASAFVDAGNRLVTLFNNGSGYSWDIRPQSWARRACQVARRTLTRTEWNDVLPERKYAPACAAR
jgi:WD40 repeat protein/class 3 adenylate cyclase/tRNA A-37 threonylcarbamoyl transferase component Bud32